LSAQWRLIETVLNDAEDRTRLMRERQRAAAAQLDAATYALQSLKHEMAPALMNLALLNPSVVAAPVPAVSRRAAHPLKREPFRRREPRAA
jgi:hypothetical protein